MKKTAWFLLSFCFACTPKPKTPAVQVSIVNNAIMGEINRDTASGVWKSLLPVYRMPKDTDLKDYQSVQPGIYRLKDSAIVFTPDTPFAKGQTYFMRFYQFGGNSTWDFISGKKKLRSVHYIDLPFK
ncbi:MAG TPA: hypothetical protein DCO83_12810 [Mucilaginibacter sp.]|nr:hypothetical protein [Mucilaginibacter sp.]